MSTEPQGVVCVLTAPDGRVVAHAADFSEGGAAGFTEQGRQKLRAEHALHREFVHVSSASWISESVDTHLAGQITRAVMDLKGFVKTYISIGYPEEEE